ncbi:MAG: SPFH domain-containing protein [Planctomycetota bacterium]|jgi:membrane protease subunit HflK
MTEQNKENNEDLGRPVPEKSVADELDAAGKSLSEALRISFIVLKIIMIVLVAAFLASGFKTIGSDEQALVLRFGKIRGAAEERLLDPGLHWIFPYPIDEIVRIPVAKKVNLAVNSFWYFQTKEEKLAGGKGRIRPEDPLKPTVDGYCLTRSEKQNEAIAGSAGSDYNIIHSRWQLTYQIAKPELFFKNVYVEDVKPGEIYFDVIRNTVEPLLQKLFEDAVVTAMVNYTVDDVMFDQIAALTGHVKRLLRKNLETIESGIEVVEVQLTDKTWSRQVDEAFQAAHKASQESQKAISEARTYAENTLNEATGPVAEQLFAALHDEAVSEQEKELLWSQLAGAAQEKIAEARAYRTKVVEIAKANADYLQRLLPEYRKRPKLVLHEIYQDAMEDVLNNTDEKIIIQQGAEDTEVRILLSRDQTLKPKSEKEE